ncbi:deoxynucleotide monophosphate kinase family protein [Streptomyces sp. NPDC055025]
MKTPLLGLAGAARSGKDTAASSLADCGWQRKAFADPVREMLYHLNPVLIDPLSEAGTTTVAWEVDNYGWDYVKSEFPEVRGYLQRLGTEAGRRVIDERIWIDTLFRDYGSWGSPAVITDVRFRNEAEEIKARGGLVVKIVRPSQALIDGAEHISENALGGWEFDATVLNVGTVDQLGASIRSIVASM